MKNLQLKKHALTAISYMLPLVVTAGLLIAIGNLTDGQVISDYKAAYSVPDALVSLGVLGMGLIAPVMAAGIAYSIADRPGIAPGLFMGLIANSIGAGFLGGMLGGYLIGFFLNWMKNTIKVPKWAEGLMPMMILPMVSTTIIGLLMFFVLGVPIVWLSDWLTETLQGLQGGSSFIFGAVMGGMAAFDFGGPVNKVASLFADGLLLEGIYGPEACKICASMIPPFGVTLAWIINRKKYTKQEADNIKIAFPMGVCMITEGVIPIAANDPLRVIGACTAGGALGGALIMTLGVGSPVPSGGMFIVPAMENPIGFLIALGAGTLLTAIILVITKKEAVEQVVIEEEEEEVDLSDVVITG
ncbi:PTS system fructose-specific IIC component [Breznakia sp. PF5-3]|uniref:PTS fructose transporter subunit IIC n=1 Tax=unclassified Breznakia TaxID=2623764 RepID=UPI002406705D|nr:MULTISPECIES: PTS fructose transporter subunit IIC [unclassified Breznakia]MDL2276016.1 PTS fructose transporter subunit IIC [Breznakia sp. OttesenSCG-928-G09]MDF9824341.1 PTS system fructose-specific IIC component [Breznakia sp. PM6-1]MDF9835068.1 PTS system fructose-specific IIC component [Breznakia sp. PF5-3]MDF9837761.1 PTS system fructose-specific IIC component [Breznakia sp. PFB2-8]MDF9859640.1 PTS system fructose-specific IIC component [Breznakia sp. PH5-24]